jgi:hypothetical protein
MGQQKLQELHSQTLPTPAIAPPNHNRILRRVMAVSGSYPGNVCRKCPATLCLQEKREVWLVLVSHQMMVDLASVVMKGC